MAINMDPLQKQMLDDVFDAFTMLSNGGFVSLMHVDGGFTRYSAGAVELFGLPGEYIPNGAMDWNDYLTRMAAEYVKRINVKGIRSPRMRDIVRGFSVTTLQGNGFSDSLSLDALIGKYDQGGAES